jgi:predicted peptidase
MPNLQKMIDAKKRKEKIMLSPGRQQVQQFHQAISRHLNTEYLLYVPKAYESSPQHHWPCLLFLHGAGERGRDLHRVKSQGLPKMLQSREDFPFLVVSPQCSSSTTWHIGVLDAVLNEVVSSYRIDRDRLYVTGLSMGGFGTWSLAIDYPSRFAAIAPICGGGDPKAVCIIKHLPVWAFHGAKDPIVPLASSEVMVETLKRCGGNVRFTVYPQADHDCWTLTYANEQLYDWFLEHRRTALNT